jgi:uncharacterized protein YkwD
MRQITSIALIEIVIIAAILICTPILTSIGTVIPGSSESGQVPPISEKLISEENPILTTNTTTAEAMLSYSQTAQQTTTIPPVGITFLDEIERHILTLTNKERRKHGLNALQHDPMLQNSARAHSVDMLERNFFDHVSPDGKALHDRIAIIHRQLIGMTGENLWQGQGYDVNDAQTLAALAVEGWMNSPGHRENMLRKEYTHLGVGGTVKGDTVKLTQNFASTQALFQQPLPLQITSGDNLPLATIAGSQKTAPEKYAMWLPDQGKLAAKPVFTHQTQITVAPGDYRLRLYFVASRQRNSVSYIIYDGPQLIIK